MASFVPDELRLVISTNGNSELVKMPKNFPILKRTPRRNEASTNKEKNNPTPGSLFQDYVSAR
jgi:hypothetical protein